MLDRAFEWAEKCGLLVLLDLHTAPGCQNGFDNGGIKGVCEWHTKKEYIDFALLTLERLAARYGQHPCLLGIEVLNEPGGDIGTDLLRRYKEDAYSLIRKHANPADVAVVFHDGFRSWDHYRDFLKEYDFSNVVFDIHCYQCFT